MSDNAMHMFVDTTQFHPTVPKLDVKRPRSYSSHSNGSSGSTGSLGDSSSSSGTPSGKHSPTPPSVVVSEEELDYYFFDGQSTPSQSSSSIPATTSSWNSPSMKTHQQTYFPAGAYNGYHPGTVSPPLSYTPMGPSGYMQPLPPQYMTPVPMVPRHISMSGRVANFNVPYAGYHGGMMAAPAGAAPIRPQRRVQQQQYSRQTTSTPPHSHDRRSYAFQRDGSLRLQEFIPSASTEQRQNILNDLHDQLPALSRTPYGNYVVQKLIQHGTPQQRLTIVQSLKHHFESLATDLYGHRVVSKALEYGDDTCKSIILGSLLASFKDIVNDEHGNYVAQKCIKTLATYQCEAIWEKFFGRVWITATHKFGHCVLKTLFLYAPPQVKDRVLEEISKNVILLAKDPYGNYVLQHILDKEQYGDLLPRHNIIASLLEQFDDLSCNKFASNVVEKCLRCADKTMFDALIVRFTSTSNKKLGKLINNPFGNYVVKTMLNLCNMDQKERVRSRCVRIYQRIRCSCAVPAIFGERRVELEQQFRDRRPDSMDEEDDTESQSSESVGPYRGMSL